MTIALPRLISCLSVVFVAPKAPRAHKSPYITRIIFAVVSFTLNFIPLLPSDGPLLFKTELFLAYHVLIVQTPATQLGGPAGPPPRRGKDWVAQLHVKAFDAQV